MGEYLKQPILYVASDELLRCRACYVHRWTTTKRLTHFSRRQLVTHIEQYLARSSTREFRFMDTGALYRPDWCWSDVDARWVSYYLTTRKAIDEVQPRRFCLKKLEYQRQLDCYLKASVASYAMSMKGLAQAHQHAGWERM